MSTKDSSDNDGPRLFRVRVWEGEATCYNPLETVKTTATSPTFYATSSRFPPNKMLLKLFSVESVLVISYLVGLFQQVSFCVGGSSRLIIVLDLSILKFLHLVIGWVSEVSYILLLRDTEGSVRLCVPVWQPNALIYLIKMLRTGSWAQNLDQVC